ncbi:MAG: hypothetical protein PHD01_06070 [Geobacteraceae bacterium]|nr:hypothetical protein [Geobacteraceae bacterium]
MKTKTICPACGSSDVVSSEKTRTLPIPYSDSVKVREKISTCSICGMKGDFSEDENIKVHNKITTAKRESVPRILDWLSEHGIRMAYIERALDLPTRTVNRWRSKAASSSAIALVQIIRTYPWILEVAESGFSEEVARNKLGEEATREYIHASSQGVAMECSVHSYPITDNITGFHVLLNRGKIPPTQHSALFYGPEGEEQCNYSIS